VGDIEWLEKNYKFENVASSLDELVVINASRESMDFSEFAESLTRLVKHSFIPICAGGGIRCLDDAKILFDNGADKIILNTLIFENKKIVLELIEKYGSQSIVASVDYKNHDVFTQNGSHKIGVDLKKYINYVASLGIGEIYLNSIDNDGTGFGYDLETAKKLVKDISIPLIIAGGAGNEKHLLEGLKIEGIDAVATANLFNFVGSGLENARKWIISNNGNLAQFD
jgi:cyclase